MGLHAALKHIVVAEGMAADVMAGLQERARVPDAHEVPFLLTGLGFHVTQTAGLALATDLAPEDKRPRAVALLYVMLLVGMMEILVSLDSLFLVVVVVVANKKVFFSFSSFIS